MRSICDSRNYMLAISKAPMYNIFSIKNKKRRNTNNK
jgi:hypothetical protein